MRKILASEIRIGDRVVIAERRYLVLATRYWKGLIELRTVDGVRIFPPDKLLEIIDAEFWP